MLCMVNDYVTDVIVMWSDVIDHIYYLVGLMLSQRNVYYIGFLCYKNQSLSERCYCHMV